MPRTASAADTARQPDRVRRLLRLSSSLLTVLLFGSACITHVPESFVQVEDAARLLSSRRFYVERQPGDRNQLDELIRRELVARGLDAGAGRAAGRPADTEIIVRYFDRLDKSVIIPYVRLLTLSFVDASSEEFLAAGRSSTPLRADVEAMVHEAVASTFIRASTAAESKASGDVRPADSQ